MRKAFFGFALAAVFVATPAFAQEGGVGPSGGDWEITIGGGGTTSEDVDGTDFDFDGELGYYLDRHWLVGVRQGVGFSDTTGGDNDFVGDTTVFVDYHFDGFGEFRPFVGANLGFTYGESVTDTFSGGPEAGLKWYVKPETFLFGRARFDYLFDDGDEGSGDDFGDGRFVYTVGVGFNF